MPTGPESTRAVFLSSLSDESGIPGKQEVLRLVIENNRKDYIFFRP